MKAAGLAGDMNPMSRVRCADHFRVAIASKAVRTADPT